MDEDRYSRLAPAFRVSFATGDFQWCDFRPHFNGFWINAGAWLLPANDVAMTRQAAIDLLEAIADWLCQNRQSFGADDVLQLIVGFPESVKPSCRQIFKCRIKASRLAFLRGVDFAAAGGSFCEM
jgi:hypothetical protein